VGVASLAAVAVVAGFAWSRATAGGSVASEPCTTPATAAGDRLAGPCALQRGDLLVADVGGRTRTYRLGRAGDVVVVGDWDCDGLATPGLYRPSTGEAFEYDSWDPGSGGAPPVTVVRLEPHATARVARVGPACDAIATG
jgi:hypothetical protein